MGARILVLEGWQWLSVGVLLALGAVGVILLAAINRKGRRKK
jgi:hypothetical protein